MIGILLEARIQTGRAKRALWVMWAVATALAVLAAAPVVASLSRYFGHSRMATRLTLEFDLAAAMEWIRHGLGELPVAMTALLAGVVLVMVAASAFVSGGALAQLAGRGGFWQGGGQFFWRFLRLAVFAGIFYMTAVSLVAWAAGGVNHWFRESMEEWPSAVVKTLLDALALLLVWVIAVGFDYAKVRMVVDGTRSAAVAGFAGLGFVLRHAWRTLAPAAFIALCGAVLFGFYQTAYNVFDYRGLRTILITIAGQQLYLVLRLWLRLWHWSACLRIDVAVRRPASPWALAEPEPYGDNI